MCLLKSPTSREWICGKFQHLCFSRLHKQGSSSRYIYHKIKICRRTMKVIKGYYPRNTAALPLKNRKKLEAWIVILQSVHNNYNTLKEKRKTLCCPDQFYYRRRGDLRFRRSQDQFCKQQITQHWQAESKIVRCLHSCMFSSHAPWLLSHVIYDSFCLNTSLSITVTSITSHCFASHMGHISWYCIQFSTNQHKQFWLYI